MDTILNTVHTTHINSSQLTACPGLNQGHAASVRMRKSNYMRKQSNTVQIHHCLTFWFNPEMKSTTARAAVLKNCMFIRIFWPSAKKKKKPFIHLTHIYSPPTQWGYNGNQEGDTVFFSHKVFNVVTGETDINQRIIQINIKQQPYMKQVKSAMSAYNRGKSSVQGSLEVFPWGSQERTEMRR